jgi:carboxymethylenebutenolidase
MTRYETISDGFEAYLALPSSGTGPGVVVFQEIFGINDNIRGICDRLAGEGYVALAPDMFWRLEKRFERKDESGMQDGMALVQKLDWGLAAQDTGAAVAHLRGLTDKVGAIGFCLGGTLTYLCATSTDVDAAVPYYGSGIHDMLGLAENLTAPTLFHYGDRDPFIPVEQIEQVEEAMADKENVTVQRHAAGHAFSNWDAPSMYDERAAAEAWAQTDAFLAQHLRA